MIKLLYALVWAGAVNSDERSFKPWGPQTLAGVTESDKIPNNNLTIFTCRIENQDCFFFAYKIYLEGFKYTNKPNPHIQKCQNV